MNNNQMNNNQNPQQQPIQQPVPQPNMQQSNVQKNLEPNMVAQQHVKNVVNMDKKNKESNVKRVNLKDNKIRFNYTIKDKNGKIIKGYFDALSKIDVHSFLIGQGYEIVSIEEDKLSTKMGFAAAAPRRKMRDKELNFFLTQLSTYIKSGIPLVESVAILSRQTKKKKDKYLFQRIVFELNKGTSFSEALTRQGDVFPNLLINMIKTSELTGDLTSILDDMAIYYRNSEATRKQIKSAMTYPTVVFLFATVVVAFIMLYVVPEFVGIYDQAGMDLPLITVIIINISDYLQTNWIVLLILIVLLIIVLCLLYKNVDKFREFCQNILMRIPVISKLMQCKEVVMFTSTFASLVNHDVFITDSMAILMKITNNEIYKKLIAKSIENLSTGEGVSKAFEGHWAFPATAYEMLVTGEKTGRLGPMMQTVADYYQEEQSTLVTQLKSLIEPIMIVCLAIIVGVVLLAIIIPMFSMYGGILE